MSTTQAAKTHPKSKTSEEKQDEHSSWSEKAAGIAHETVDSVALKAASAEETLRDAASNSSESFQENKLVLEDKINESIAKARIAAAKNPLATAGIAFAAGMLLTALIRRR